MSENEQKTRPWDRRESETNAQWQAFKCYRDLGLSRSIPKAWEKYKSERDLSGSDPHPDFWDWYKENEWKDRAKAWDQYQDEMIQAKRRQAVAEVFEVLSDKGSEVAKKLMTVALGQVHKTQKVGFEDYQLDAMIEILDRLGIKPPEKLEISGGMDHDHDHDHSHQVDLPDPDYDKVRNAMQRLADTTEPEGDE